MGRRRWMRVKMKKRWRKMCEEARKEKEKEKERGKEKEKRKGREDKKEKKRKRKSGIPIAIESNAFSYSDHLLILLPLHSRENERGEEVDT